MRYVPTTGGDKCCPDCGGNAHLDHAEIERLEAEIDRLRAEIETLKGLNADLMEAAAKVLRERAVAGPGRGR